MRDIYEAYVAVQNGAYCKVSGEDAPNYIACGLMIVNDKGYKDILVRVKRRDREDMYPIDVPMNRVFVAQYRGKQLDALEKLERLRKGRDHI